MKASTILTLGVLFNLSCVLAHAASILNLSEFQTSKENPSLMPGEMRFERTYDLGQGRTMPVVVEVTTKGNGMMRALNVEVPVYDVHNDGNLFRNWLLNVELADLDGDGFKDLIIFGIVDNTDEKSGRVVSSMSVTAIFHYDSARKSMKLRFFSGPDELREWFIEGGQ